MLVKRIAVEYHRALARGEQPEQAEQTAFLAISHEYAGERVYIAGVPKAQRARQLAQINLSRTRDLVEATGLPERTVRRLMRGK